jgi:uncharacterized protein
MGYFVMSHNWNGKIAVITGASSGIGAATAQRLAGEGMQVILVARRLDRLASLVEAIRQAGGQAEAIQADLTCEADCTRVYEEVSSRYGHVDVLVNNAGFGWYGFGADMPWNTAVEMLKVNVEAVVQLTLQFLVKMRENNKGHIINIGSISGSLPSQGIAVYGATKAFIDNFTTALYREMRGTFVHLSVVRAGPVLTEFSSMAANRQGGLHLPTERHGVTAEMVAERVWGLLRRPRRVTYIPGYLLFTPWLENSFGWLIDRLGPLLLTRQNRPTK